jgi:hypothetical protein
MCLAMSLTSAETFARYRELRAFRLIVERIVGRLSPADHADLELLLEACAVATHEEHGLLHIIMERAPKDFALMVDWAHAVLWEHEEWPGPF